MARRSELRGHRLVARLPALTPGQLVDVPSPRPKGDDLSLAERQFVTEYLLDLDPAAAAIRAGFDASQGRSLLSKPQVQDSIARARRRLMREAKIGPEEVLRRWWAVANADARNLIKVIYVNCRYCWGVGHSFQFRDEDELEAIKAQYEHEQLRVQPHLRRSFDESGGIGYERLRDPCRGPTWVQFGLGGEATASHSCPRCSGFGEKIVWLADSRHYDEGSALMYDGVKVGRDGSIEVKVRDRDKALDRVAQHLGMLAPKQVRPLDPARLSDEELDNVIERLGESLGDNLVVNGEELVAAESEVESE